MVRTFQIDEGPGELEELKEISLGTKEGESSRRMRRRWRGMVSARPLEAKLQMWVFSQRGTGSHLSVKEGYDVCYQDHWGFSRDSRWKEVTVMPREQRGGWFRGPGRTMEIQPTILGAYRALAMYQPLF